MNMPDYIPPGGDGDEDSPTPEELIKMAGPLLAKVNKALSQTDVPAKRDRRVEFAQWLQIFFNDIVSVEVVQTIEQVQKHTAYGSIVLQINSHRIVASEDTRRRKYGTDKR